jgi:uncharacterized protein YaaR (DUF327 family)
MQEHNIDKKQLEKNLSYFNITNASLINWYKGKIIPKRENIIKLCIALGCNILESNILISKFAGEQRLNAYDIDDAAYLYCLNKKVKCKDVELYIQTKDLFKQNNEDINDIFFEDKDDFIRVLENSKKMYNSNSQKIIKVLNEMIDHPKIYHGEYTTKDGRLKPIAEFMYGVEDSKKAMNKLQKILNGRLAIKRDEFIKITIACGYCGVEEINNNYKTADIHACIKEINEKLEEAGFFQLYARNKKDCIYIATSIQTVLNEENNLADYLKELSQLFQELDKEYYIFEPENI